jgi:hypothetical protein
LFGAELPQENTNARMITASSSDLDTIVLDFIDIMVASPLP